MNKRIFGVMTAMSLAMSVASMGAWAGNGDAQPGTAPGTGKTPGQDRPTRPITLEEMKARCLNPNGFNEQQAPQNIRVQCTDISQTYVLAEAGSVPMPSARQIITTVIADKYHVEPTTHPVEGGSKPGTCPRYKEVERTLRLERPMSCSEVLGMKTSVEEMCLNALQNSKANHPKNIEQRDTGNFIDTCGSPNNGTVPAPVPGKGGTRF